MPAAYPSSLPIILRASKSRSQPAAFGMSNPRRGPGYVQATGTDVPVFWDAEFRFSREEAQLFQLWFVYGINRGIDEFTMPIRTEFGLITHTCRFQPDSLLPATEQGEMWIFKATILTRAQIIPDEFVAAAPLLLGLPNARLWMNLLDQTINRAMPQA